MQVTLKRPTFRPDLSMKLPRNMDEADILDNSFSLIFAFDEIVALGYRESVNLAQIRTFVEMDSHEEKVAILCDLQQLDFLSAGVQCCQTDSGEGC